MVTAFTGDWRRQGRWVRVEMQCYKNPDLWTALAATFSAQSNNFVVSGDLLQPKNLFYSWSWWGAAGNTDKVSWHQPAEVIKIYLVTSFWVTSPPHLLSADQVQLSNYLITSFRGKLS